MPIDPPVVTVVEGVGGVGRPLTVTEFDDNVLELKRAIDEILADSGMTGRGIDSISVVGDEMTVLLDDATSLGPFTLPKAFFNPRGNWSATAYVKQDCIVGTTSATLGNGYACIVAHTGVDLDADLAAGKWVKIVSRGPQGFTGLQGITGIGMTGLRGITGLQGITGVGTTGPQGVTGPGVGMTGYPGPQGVTGPGVGMTGYPGPTGLPGATGTSAPAFRGCLLKTGGALSTTSAVPLILTWNLEIFDSDSFHSTVTNNSRITIPSGLGITRVLLSASVFWDAPASSGGGSRQLWITKNGGVDFGLPQMCIETPLATNLLPMTITSGPVDCTAGDYFEAVAYQDSGGALPCNDGSTTYFSLVVLG